MPQHGAAALSAGTAAKALFQNGFTAAGDTYGGDVAFRQNSLTTCFDYSK